MNGIKAIVIARVSSKEQAEGYSIEAQKRPIIEYCHRNGFKAVKCFEFWESAGKKDRKKFKEAIDFVLGNDIKVIAVEKTDRLYRNFRDYVLMEDLIEEQGVSVHFVKEGEVFDRNSNSHSKVIHGFKVLMAKSYLDNLSEEIKKGMGQKASNGLWPHKAPIGYKNNSSTRLIEVDPEKAPYIKKLFKMYASCNHTLDSLVAYLNNRDIKTVNGAIFHPSTVHRILTNPVYYGDFRFRGELIKGKHKPIVTFEEWQSCQEFMQRTDLPGRQRKYSLSGVLFNEHDRVYSGEKHKGHIYYSSRQPGTKKKMFIREDTVFAALDEFVWRIRWSEIFSDQIQKIAKEVLREEKKFLNSSVSVLNREIKNGGRRQEKLLNLHLDGELARQTFLEKKREIEKEIKKKEELLARHKRGDKAFEKKVADLVRVFTEVPKAYNKAARSKKAQLLRLFAARVVADGAKNIRIELREPYNLFVGREVQEAASLTTKKAVRAHPVIWTIKEHLRTMWASA